MTEGKRLARVFPRRIEASTPTDKDAYVGYWDMFAGDYDEVHISVTFTEDIAFANEIEKQWRYHGKTSMSGPALGDPGGEFVPGRYIKPGYVITSRGCPNDCWFCKAWKNEGRTIRELPITEGWNVLDNNLLACSREHQEGVFAMLQRQKETPRFTGGFEAERFTDWHAEWMAKLKPDEFYFAYDLPEDMEHVYDCACILESHGLLTGHRARCYVLVGFKGDTRKQAEKRLIDVARLGIMPMAMLYEMGNKVTDGTKREWKDMLAPWIQPRRVGAKMREYRLD